MEAPLATAAPLFWRSSGCSTKGFYPGRWDHWGDSMWGGTFLSYHKKGTSGLSPPWQLIPTGFPLPHVGGQLRLPSTSGTEGIPQKDMRRLGPHKPHLTVVTPPGGLLLVIHIYSLFHFFLPFRGNHSAMYLSLTISMRSSPYFFLIPSFTSGVHAW